MRDYEDLKNLKIPAEQERIMDIICDVWEECRATDCPGECKDNQVLPCEHSLFACTALKYSRKIHEVGYAPVKWIDVNDRLPETADDVLVALWCESKHGYLEWDRYSDGHGGSSSYKVIAWVPIPTYKEKENG